MNIDDSSLGAGLATIARDTPHDPDLAGTVIRRYRRRRVAIAAPIGASVAVAAVVVTAVMVRSPASPAPASNPVSACHPITTALIPPWARAGFSDAEPRIPLTYSNNGLMVALVFASPLISPAVPDLGNKILWVSRPAESDGKSPATSGAATTTSNTAPANPDLVITGHLEGTSTTMTTTVSGGPGPSIVDVPSPGCWHLDLAWSGERDSIDLLYASSVPAAPTR